MTKVIFIPGNGGASVKAEDGWFPYLKKELGRLGLEVIDEDFPDPELARAQFWLPFLEKLGADEQTILVGHSSGAIAAMRFAEKKRLLGSVLVGSYYTDLGEESEKLSGYFDEPWDWEAIKAHQQWLIQFHSTDDPWIPTAEAHVVRNRLGTEYYEFSDQGHFGGDRVKTEFPELVEAIKSKI